MVVNCLPLFMARPDAESATSGGKGTSTEEAGRGGQEQDVHSLMHEPRKQERRQTKAMRRFVLKKASSAENLLAASSPASKTSKYDQKKRSSEAEDILDENMRSSVKVQRNVWTHFNTAQTPNKVSSEGVKDEEPESAKVTTSTEEGNDGAKVEGTDGGNVEQKEEKGHEDKMVLSDGGSDGEESKEMKVSYIEDPEHVQTLKRSSGSVSFIGTAATRRSPGPRSLPPPPSVVEEVSEGSEEREGETASSDATGVTVTVEGEDGEGVTLVGSEGTDGGEGERVPPGSEEAVGEGGRGGDHPKPKPEANGVDLVPEQPPQEKAVVAQATPSAPPLVPPASVPPALAPTEQSTEQAIHTALPPAPVTFEPEFIERSGWLMKLSHRRGQ